MTLRLSKACVGPEELAEIATVFEKTVNFGLGVHVAAFEKELATAMGDASLHVVCVNTGTAALHLALEALDFPRGSEVLVPSITFVASYAAISAAGLVPVSCEVTFPDCHLDPDDLEARITPKTAAIMPVAYAGVDFQRASIYALAKKHNLRVVEDDAHAFGSLNADGVAFGASGDVVCFSFDGIKNITCGEGGAVVTRDAGYAHALRVRRSLGIEKDVELRYQGKRAWEYDVAVQGFRYHMSNINAAIGSAQLRKLPEFVRRKKDLLAAYTTALEKEPFVGRVESTQRFTPDACFHILSCLLAPGIDRARVRSRMLELGFETGIHYVPNHTHTLYRSPEPLPVSEDIGRRLLSLPFHANMTVEDVGAVLRALSSALQEP